MWRKGLLYKVVPRKILVPQIVPYLLTLTKIEAILRGCLQVETKKVDLCEFCPDAPKVFGFAKR